MPKTYRNPVYPYRRSPDQDAKRPTRHPVIVVGAGPVGLTAALDLARRGVAVLVLDEDDTVSVGSRAICFAQRSLEIFDRLGVGQRMVDKGVTWSRGKVFFGERPIYAFDLLPEAGYKRPPFINLQQYYVEQFLIERAAEVENVEIRWGNRVSTVESSAAGVRLAVETAEGAYTLECDYLIAADGAKSAVRRALGLAFTPATRRSCTASRTTFGASTCSSVPGRTARRSGAPSGSCPGSGPCSARIRRSISIG